MSRLSSGPSCRFGAQAVTPIAHLFSVCIHASFSRRTFNWRAVCFSERCGRGSTCPWARPCLLRRSQLKRCLHPVEPRGGERWFILVSFLSFVFLLIHRAIVDFLHSCNAVNSWCPPPLLKHAGLMDIYIDIHKHVHCPCQHRLRYLYFVIAILDRITSKMSWRAENLHCCRYLIVCVTYARGKRPSSIAIMFIVAHLMRQAPPPPKKNCTVDMISHLVLFHFKLRSSTVYVNQEVCI